MKLKHLLFFALAGVISYTSCQKSAVTQATPAVDYNAVASQIALSLNKSLTGQLGGTSINDGLNAASNVKTPNGKTISSLPFCGEKIDTAYSSYTTSGDTTKWLSGKFNFQYTCSSSSVDGYNVYDSLRTEVHNASFINEYTNAQNYAFKVVNSSTSSLAGTITTLTSSTIYATTSKAQEYHDMSCFYALSNVVIKTTNGVTDVTSGTATFNSKTSDIDAQTGAVGLFAKYTGTLTWIGNHKANLTIDPGHKFVIDFTTNTITPVK